MTLQLWSQLKLPLSYIYFSSTNTHITSCKEFWIMKYTSYMFEHFFVKNPNNNLRLNLTFLSDAYTLLLLNFHSLKANAKHQGMLSFSIECQCLHIKHWHNHIRHQYKANVTRIFPLFWRWSIILFFPSSPILNYNLK